MRTGIYYEVENPEEKSPTDDKIGADEVQTDGMQLSNLMGNFKGLQSKALARERFDDATDIQTAVLATIDAACNNAGLDVGLITTIRSCLHKLFRKNRNRGLSICHGVSKLRGRFPANAAVNFKEICK